MLLSPYSMVRSWSDDLSGSSLPKLPTNPQNVTRKTLPVRKSDTYIVHLEHKSHTKARSRLEEIRHFNINLGSAKWKWCRQPNQKLTQSSITVGTQKAIHTHTSITPPCRSFGHSRPCQYPLPVVEDDSKSRDLNENLPLPCEEPPDWWCCKL